MRKQKSKTISSTAKKKKANKKKCNIKDHEMDTSWVATRLEWIPTIESKPQNPQQHSQIVSWLKQEGKKENDNNNDYDVSIISWNVLADAYCSKQNHQHLPMKFQRHVFDRHQRQHHVRQILRGLVTPYEEEEEKKQDDHHDIGDDDAEEDDDDNNNNNNKNNNNEDDDGEEHIDHNDITNEIKQQQQKPLNTNRGEGRRIRLTPKLQQPPDLLALQEVDTPLEISSCLEEFGYKGIESPTTPGGASNGRVDAVALYYRQENWICQDYQIIELDDLAIRCSKSKTTVTSSSSPSSSSSSIDSSTTTSRCIASSSTNLQGIQGSFVRKNMALLVHLTHTKQPKKQILVAVVHLFWNPAYEYVKLCQIHYILKRAKAFQDAIVESNANNSVPPPLILCGDFNSLPTSHVYNYLVQGRINAKLVTPWYHRNQVTSTNNNNNNNNDNDKDPDFNNDGSIRKDNGDDCNMKDITGSTTTPSVDEVVNGIKDMNVSNTKEAQLYSPKKDKISLKSEPSVKSSPSSSTTNLHVRYMLDYTLNRFCRWLRILGLDAALETEEEERIRTKTRSKNGKIGLFTRCEEEHRTLVTTSSKLLLRRDCPPGTYLLNTASLKDLEFSLVHLLLSHGVTLEPSKFLTRCVVCNGHIGRIHEEEQIKEILASYGVVDDDQNNNNNNNEKRQQSEEENNNNTNNNNNKEDNSSRPVDVFQCNGCKQGYWWCDQPTSSASRVKNQATKLLELCIREGVPIDENNMAMFDFVIPDEVRRQKRNYYEDNNNNNVNQEQETKRNLDKKMSNKKQENKNTTTEDSTTTNAIIHHHNNNNNNTNNNNNLSNSTGMYGLKERRLDVLDWLQEEDLINPFGCFTSTYERKKNDKNNDEGNNNKKEEELLSFTNVTANFVGLLDYILFPTTTVTADEGKGKQQQWNVIDRLYVPTTFDELMLSNEDQRNGHLLPSNVWPSDHLAIGVRLQLVDLNNNNNNNDEKDKNTIIPIMDNNNTVTTTPTTATTATTNTNTTTATIEDEKEDSNTVNSIRSTTNTNTSSDTIAMTTMTSATTTSSSTTTTIDTNVEIPLWCAPIAPLKQGVSSSSEKIVAPPAVVLQKKQQQKQNQQQQKQNQQQQQQQHGQLCSCGCVPNVPSLFQMAELRKQYREKLKREQEQQQQK